MWCDLPLIPVRKKKTSIEIQFEYQYILIYLYLFIYFRWNEIKDEYFNGLRKSELSIRRKGRRKDGVSEVRGGGGGGRKQ